MSRCFSSASFPYCSSSSCPRPGPKHHHTLIFIVTITQTIACHPPRRPHPRRPVIVLALSVVVHLMLVANVAIRIACAIVIFIIRVVVASRSSSPSPSLVIGRRPFRLRCPCLRQCLWSRCPSACLYGRGPCWHGPLRLRRTCQRRCLVATSAWMVVASLLRSPGALVVAIELVVLVHHLTPIVLLADPRPSVPRSRSSVCSVSGYSFCWHAQHLAASCCRALLDTLSIGLGLSGNLSTWQFVDMSMWLSLKVARKISRCCCRTQVIVSPLVRWCCP